MGTTAAASRRSRRSRAFRSLAGNRALLRVLVAYLLFTLTEYAVWIAMLVFAYGRGGTATAGLVAVARLAPAAVVAPVVASVADRRSPVVLLAGGYLAQAAAMAGTAAAVSAGAPLAAYAGAVVAATAVTATRPAQSALIPSVAATPDQLTAANVVLGWMEAAGVAAAGLLAGVRPVQLSAGAVLIRQGDPGDAYFAIAAGELDAEQDGRFLGRYGRGEGVGEIALLRAVPRTATVTAHTAATAYRLDRDPFLTAVLGHAPTRRQADRIAAARLATDRAISR